MKFLQALSRWIEPFRLKQRVLDGYESSLMNVREFPDLPSISFHAHLVEKYLFALREIDSVLVVDKNAAHVQNLISRKHTGTEVIPLEAARLLNPETIAWFPERVSDLLTDHDRPYHFLGGLCCMDSTSSSYIMRRSSLVTSIGTMVKTAALFVFCVDPVSLAVDKVERISVRRGIRIRDFVPTYNQLFVRQQLHRAGFYDVAAVMTLVDGLPVFQPWSISRSDHNGFFFVDRSHLNVKKTNAVSQVFLASKVPLTQKIVL